MCEFDLFEKNPEFSFLVKNIRGKPCLCNITMILVAT